MGGWEGLDSSKLSLAAPPTFTIQKLSLKYSNSPAELPSDSVAQLVM